MKTSTHSLPSLLPLAGALLLALPGALLPASAQEAPPAEPALVLRGRLYRPAQEPIPDGAVVIQGGKVFAAGAWGRVSKLVPAGAKTVQVPAISPGLIEASSQIGTQGVYAEQRSEVVPELRVLDTVDLSSRAFDRLLERGITAVHVDGDPASVVGSQGCVVKTGGKERVLVEAGAVHANIGPDSWSRGFNRRPRGTPSYMTRRPNTLMGAVWVFRDAFFQAKQAKAPTDAQAVLREVMAGKRQLRFEAHRRGEIEAALRLSKEAGAKVVLEEAQEVHNLIDLVAQAEASVIYGPLEDLQRSERKGVLEPRLDTPELLAQAGVTFCLTAGGEGGQDDLRGQALLAVRYGLDPGVALDAVTSAPAEILGVQSRIGALTKGLDADLVVWSGAPLAATSKPLAVLIDGNVVSGRLPGEASQEAEKKAPDETPNPPRGPKKNPQRF